MFFLFSFIVRPPSTAGCHFSLFLTCLLPGKEPFLRLSFVRLDQRKKGGAGDIRFFQIEMIIGVFFGATHEKLFPSGDCPPNFALVLTLFSSFLASSLSLLTTLA